MEKVTADEVVTEVAVEEVVSICLFDIFSYVKHACTVSKIIG